MKTEEKRFEENKELKKYIEISDFLEEEIKEYYFLSHPNSLIVKILKSKYPNISEKQIQEFINSINKLREDHPYFVPYLDEQDEKIKQTRSPFLAFKSGANYDML